MAALGGGVGHGVGVVVSLVAAAVKAVLERAHLGLEVGEALLQLGLALLDVGRGRGLCFGVGVGGEFFKFGLAPGGAKVLGLVVGGLLTGVPEGLLAGRRGWVGGADLHNREFPTSTGPSVGW